MSDRVRPGAPPTRRFELPASSGKGARFWEIRVVGQRCELRYGALVERAGEGEGDRGQLVEHDVETRTESFKNPSVAQVKAKTKIRRKRQAGYLEQGPDLSPVVALELELEQTLCEDLDDRAAWAVYADFICGRIPALGERIALALALDTAPGEQRAALAKRVALLEAQRERWQGPALADLSRRRGFDELVELGWRMGMLDALRLRSRRVFRPQCSLDAVLTAALASPVSRFMTVLRIQLDGGRSREIEHAAQRVVESGLRPALRKLEFDGQVYGAAAELPVLDSCLAIAPRLETLRLRGCLRLSAYSEHPRLRELSLSCASDKASWVARLAGLRLPALEKLSLARAREAQHSTQARELHGLLCDAELPALKELRLELGSEGNVALGELVGTPLFERLRRLSLSSTDNRAAMQILATPEHFAHLERLELHGGRIHGPIRQDLRELGNVMFV